MQQFAIVAFYCTRLRQVLHRLTENWQSGIVSANGLMV
jgi:hypothetical protein